MPSGGSIRWYEYPPQQLMVPFIRKPHVRCPLATTAWYRFGVAGVGIRLR